jgi:polyhydroxyalkanoate synthase
VLSRVGAAAAELGRVAAGNSTVAPSGRVKRFADPAWTQNPVLHRIVQSYVVLAKATEELVADVPLDWRDGERVRFAATNLVEALSPSNNPLLNPLGWKALIETGGGNVITGARQFLRDMGPAPRVPSMVDPDAYTVGVDLAAGPGSGCSAARSSNRSSTGRPPSPYGPCRC